MLLLVCCWLIVAFLVCCFVVACLLLIVVSCLLLAVVCCFLGLLLCCFLFVVGCCFLGVLLCCFLFVVSFLGCCFFGLLLCCFLLFSWFVKLLFLFSFFGCCFLGLLNCCCCVVVSCLLLVVAFWVCCWPRLHVNARCTWCSSHSKCCFVCVFYSRVPRFRDLSILGTSSMCFLQLLRAGLLLYCLRMSRNLNISVVATATHRTASVLLARVPQP